MLGANTSLIPKSYVDQIFIDGKLIYPDNKDYLGHGRIAMYLSKEEGIEDIISVILKANTGLERV